MRILILLLGLCASIASAQNLTKSTGELVCPYSSITVTSSSAVVACAGGPPPSSGGSFTITGSSSMGVGQSLVASINRTGGTAGESLVAYSVSGGCAPAAGTTWFASNGATTGLVTIYAPGSAATCVVSLTGITGAGVIASPSQLTIAVGSPPPPSGCTPFTLKLSGADILRLQSGQVACATLPNVRASGGTLSSGQILFGEATVSPRGATVEITISKTPGVIDPNAGDFYYKETNASFMQKQWIERPVWGAKTDEYAAIYQLAKAYETDGPWYVNVRYTYTASNCAYTPCGFVNQWNFGGF